MQEEEVVIDTLADSILTEEEVVLPSDEGQEEEVVIEEEVVEDKEPEEVAPKSLIEEYTAKIQANDGVITEEMYAELAAKGYDKQTVDTLKAGIEKQQEAQAAQVLTDAGTTQAEFTEAIEWARENWSQERIARFNTAVDKNTGESLTAIIESFMDTYKANSVPKVDEPLHSSTAKPSPKTRGYANMDEMIKDMQDPRYKDMYSSYYKAVREKAGRSSF